MDRSIFPQSMKYLCSLSLFVVLALSAEAKPDPIIYLPKGGQQFRVAVWLHGYRGYPGVLKERFLQDVADSLKIAIVGFPATTELGDNTQQWSEEPTADHAYIQERLASLAEKHPIDVSRVALFGFSQGAMVAADLCTRFPESYAGAIVMSPGGMTTSQAASTPVAAHKNQRFWLVCMANEHPGNVELTRSYAKHLQALGSQAKKIEYPGIREHTRPPDFQKRFPEWIADILQLDQKQG